MALQLASAFIRRFEPAAAADAAAAESSYADALAASVKEVDHGQISDEQSRELLRAMASAAKHTLRTNVHVEGRWALSLRLDPRFFAPVLPPVAAGFSNLPYGTFFIAGRHFNGYHNRFRDIARGGLRVVLPPSAEAHTAESRRHFGECFGLSWAQQLKNKDIPEGGSKAVCLVTPVPAEDRTALMHGCVKKMADAMLDLIVPSTADKVVTRAADEDASPLGDEFIYLGPDENITPVDLDWIVARAARRGYAMPSAFMSSSLAPASTTRSTASRARASPSSSRGPHRHRHRAHRGAVDGEAHRRAGRRRRGQHAQDLIRDYGDNAGWSASRTAPPPPRTPTACP